MKNKLVIIGNGFDLAHGLKTSYADFLNWLIKKIVSQKDPHPFYAWSFGQSSFEYLLNPPYVEDETNKKYISTSEFFREILKDYNEKKWVDIESVYFNLITKHFNHYKRDLERQPNILNGFSEFQIKSILQTNIQKLNTDFEVIKNELEDYLKTIKFQNDAYRYDFIPLFRDTLCSESSDKNKETLFLNFNYTTSLNLYQEYTDNKSNKILHIHGKLIDKNNPIIFGYGDEMNPYHQQIVDLNVNDLFTHYKSFKYAQTENYHKLLLFLKKPFDVYILGHSCGLSDRVLFSTIFNNANCEEIYPFYYVNDKGKDDFTEKTYELSRHFNNTSDFRLKVQPKTKCQRI